MSTMHTEPPATLESAAHLSVSLQVPFAKIRNAIHDLQIEACLSLNGIDYFSAPDCERIHEHLDHRPPGEKGRSSG